MMNHTNFSFRLSTDDLLLLDGATGSELTRRHVDTDLPLWSATALIDAPDVVGAIHEDYIRAGAQIITTNTFRTHRRSLAKGQLGHRAHELTHFAVHLIGEAIQKTRTSVSQRVFIAGSISPLEDCYSPNLVPADDELKPEHNEIAQHLAEAGVDVLLVETMNTIREAHIAAQAAHSTGLPFMVSFICQDSAPGRRRSRHAAKLLSGEPLAEAVRVVESLNPAAIMVNCTSVAQIEVLLRELRATTELPIGAYGNAGYVHGEAGWTLTDAVTPEQYAVAARTWRDLGASIIGGCCGTHPGHIAALSFKFRDQDRPIKT